MPPTDQQPWRCTATFPPNAHPIHSNRCHYPAGHAGRDAGNNWDLHQDNEGNEWEPCTTDSSEPPANAATT